MKKLLLLGIIFLFGLLYFTSCEDNNEGTDKGKISNISGLVEKGPFVSGSSVSIYELDNNLNGTGRVFEAKTNDEGAFSINTSTSLASKYVKLSVNGFYFNEYTGRLSDAPITLEAITSLENEGKANINVNILTHLEMPRVIRLVSSGTSFPEAKKQAQKELLEAFLITDKVVVPERAGITANNTSANILIAISSILLNERSDAQFTEFMSNLREDLTDGEISLNIKKRISDSSLGLSYSRIKENIQNRYEELGKTVEIGDFELFIDGDGDGQIGETYEEDSFNNVVSEENIFDSEENVKRYCTASLAQLYSFIQNQYLIEGVYTNTIDNNNLYNYELKEIYNHHITPDMSSINNLWASAYKSIRQDNIIIAKAQESKPEWFKKYKCHSQIYRACKYLNMVNLWGDVPFIKYSGQIEENANAIRRTPENEILDFIISDLEEAYEHLAKEKALSNCSKYFAKAIQAKAYLQKKEYNNAMKCLNIIIGSDAFSLSNDINSIYNGNNKENIFEIPNSNEYSNILYRELIKKGENMAVCRYAEILLMASEASMRLGDNSQALKYLNEVRYRNGRTQFDDIANIEDALLQEWRDDLKNEGLYFYALKRLNKATQILGIPDYKLLLPIPTRELWYCPNMTQNPGYN